MAMTAGTGGVNALDEGACWRLLGTMDVGRLCYPESVMPVIGPVAFVVYGSGVLVAVNQAVIPPRAVADPTIAVFEAGEWDPCECAGWSVRLVGGARPIPKPQAWFVERGLWAWIDGDPTVSVLVTAGLLTGRRVVG